MALRRLLDRIRDLVRAHPLAAYVVLAYALAWAWWLPLVFSGATVVGGRGWPTDLPGLLAPALSAVVVTAAVSGRVGLLELWGRVTRWNIPWKWYALVAATAGLGGVGLLAMAATGRPLPTWDQAAAYTGTPMWGLPAVFALVLVVNGFGEEIGWRGFAAERLLTRHSLLSTALLVALVWGGWHLPLFFLVQSFRDLGLTAIGWAIGLTCGSIVLTWMYQRGRHSILLAALWHTTYNFTSATTATHGLIAALSSTAVMLVAVAVVLGARRKHGYERKLDQMSHA